MATLTITWNAVMDEHTCPICMALNGYTWFFEVGTDEFTDELVHPEFGVVWNVKEGSKAHGHDQYNCRCRMVTDFNFADLLKRVQEIRATLESKMSKEELTK